MNKTKSFYVLACFLLLILLLPLVIYPQVKSLNNFKKVAIMENGRIKPLDTFARNILKQFSGRSKFNKKPAIFWLAKLLFMPETSYDDRIFLITNPEVLDSINIARYGKARNHYSFTQLRSGLDKLRQLALKISNEPAKQRDLIENEILSLYNRLYLYQQLLASFDFFFPHPDFSLKNHKSLELLGISEKNKDSNFFKLSAKMKIITQHLDSLQKQPEDELEDSDREIIKLSHNLEIWSKFYKKLPFTILFTFPDGNNEHHWVSPWEIVASNFSQKQPYQEELLILRNMFQAYQANDDEEFENYTLAFNDLIKNKNAEIRSSAIIWEVVYNKVDPFYKSKFFYGFAALFMLLSFIAFKKWFYKLSFFLLALGFIVNLYGVFARMYIRQRPPVTNLYETFVFTGLVAVILGFILEFTKKKNIGIFTGALAGFAMLMIAGKYSMEGDTMGMLVAVLDSNFWLASHVITIILGYSGILLSGFLGHIYLLQEIFKPEGKNKDNLLTSTFQAVYSIQAFGLIFTFLGTVLGGIWADQSWGRFWGWDPKENGALLILLWSAILFHAKLSKWIKRTGMAVGSVIGVIAVALAWFGVNLLGVGLHSYGFTTGIARNLFLFIGIEIIFLLTVSAIIIFRKQGKLP
jgi:ABC-type transport system involved in cytochrome c biogenesis permease subunit